MERTAAFYSSKGFKSHLAESRQKKKRQGILGALLLEKSLPGEFIQVEKNPRPDNVKLLTHEVGPGRPIRRTALP